MSKKSSNHPVYKLRPNKDRKINSAARKVEKLEQKVAAAKADLFVQAIQQVFNTCPSATEVQIDLGSDNGEFNTMVWVVTPTISLNGSLVVPYKRQLDPTMDVLNEVADENGKVPVDYTLPEGLLNALFVLLDAGIENCDNRDANLFTQFRESGLYVDDIEHLDWTITFKRGEPVEL